MSEAAKPGHWPGTRNNVWQRTGGGDSPGFQPRPGAGSIQYKVHVIVILLLAEMNWSHKQTRREEERSMCGRGVLSARAAAVGTM